MTYTLKLLIPIGLGVVAAAINWIAMSSATQPIKYVQASMDLKEGQRFGVDNLAAIELPSTFKNLKDTAIPYEHIGVLYGQRVRRNLKKGDILFWRDSPEGGPRIGLMEDEEIHPVSIENVDCIPSLMRIGDEVSFRFLPMAPGGQAVWVGPFRVVSVGPRLSNEPGETEMFSDPGSMKTISVAIKREGSPNRDEKFDQFEQLCDSMKMGQARLLRIKHHQPKD